MCGKFIDTESPCDLSCDPCTETCVPITEYFVPLEILKTQKALKTTEKPMFSRLSLSWRQRDSNPRPLRCERNALPAELCPRPNCYHYSTTGMNCKQRIKKTETLVNQRLPFFSSRAADGNRTRDLRTTNAVLYLLSYRTFKVLVGFEPTTSSLGGKHSIHLSY